MKKDSLGDRMKANYEHRSRYKLTRRLPVIIRLDGKAFHTFTRGCERPFDSNLQTTMCSTALALCEDVQGCKCAYVQSDEISLLLTDYDKLTTDAWFDYNLQKIVSVSAGIASSTFTICGWDTFHKRAIFDSRAFNIPKEEVCNYFIWRQQDWFRNSLQMLCQSNFSHKQLHNKNTEDMNDMLHHIGVNWAELNPRCKNGTFFYKDLQGWLAESTFIFTKDRDAIENCLESEPDEKSK